MTAEETKPEVKGIKMEEVEKHSSVDDLWLVIDGKVYDVTPFMDDHPGGGEIMLSAAGKDGTQDFEDVGHSPHARELLKKYYLDEFAGGVGSGKIATKSGGGGMSLLAVLLPILVVALAFAAKMLTA
ncbi:cytochrome b5 isoform cb5-d [Micromonas commoda]|uniref:Cytochrome b5 isoform cb5-d n=1 Tax=Micromonas commoda (strain RCC299 / NOUM17 / CCMP2709) TaxID=296587 RepID=C1FHZ2_MICCC|nr:cytochrome b5 isoform cb5-d [Micromonas commoda]ACO69903.1 cytochrome b5 isoform cb5-d [Micromonas commoda]|eukprot:XP_002508645.1 cytochrome b5 isoform cb5-d [Micromonas commoda]